MNRDNSCKDSDHERTSARAQEPVATDAARVHGKPPSALRRLLTLDVRYLPGVARRLTEGTRGAALVIAHLGLLLVSLRSLASAEAHPADFQVVSRAFLISIAGTGLGTVLAIPLTLALFDSRSISCLTRAGLSVAFASAQWLMMFWVEELHIQF